MGKMSQLDLEMQLKDKDDNYRKITKRELDTLDFGLDEEEKRLYDNSTY